MTYFQSFLESKLDKTNIVFAGELQIEIGNKIKQLRIQKKMSQSELSKLSGISQSKISQIENGSLNITLRTIEIIFGVLGYKVHITEEANDN